MKASDQPRSRKSSKPFGKSLVRLSCFAILAIGLAEFAAIAKDSPSLAADTRMAVGLDSWYPAYQPALYDRSLYMLDRAELASARWQDEKLSLKLTIAGIEAAPGNAYAWNAAAVAAASAGYEDFARVAAGRSRELAPNSGRAALHRLVVADIELEGADEATRAGVRRDLVLANAQEKAALDQILENAPMTADALKTLGFYEPFFELER